VAYGAQEEAAMMYEVKGMSQENEGMGHESFLGQSCLG
jgi:hypothetical protein